MSKIQHAHLVAGEIVFTVGTEEDNDGEVNAVRVNSVLWTPERQILATDLGRAQQTLQLVFFQRMQGAEIEVRDVVLLHVSYLGKMTQEAFAKGLDQAVERPKPEASGKPPADVLSLVKSIHASDSST